MLRESGSFLEWMPDKTITKKLTTQSKSDFKQEETAAAFVEKEIFFCDEKKSGAQDFFVFDPKVNIDIEAKIKGSDEKYIDRMSK